MSAERERERELPTCKVVFVCVCPRIGRTSRQPPGKWLEEQCGSVLPQGSCRWGLIMSVRRLFIVAMKPWKGCSSGKREQSANQLLVTSTSPWMPKDLSQLPFLWFRGSFQLQNFIQHSRTLIFNQFTKLRKCQCWRLPHPSTKPKLYWKTKRKTGREITLERHWTSQTQGQHPRSSSR